MGFNNYRLNYLKDFAVDVKISQLNKKNLPIYTVILHNAFPVTFNSIALDNSAENSVQKFSVTMAYENFFVDSVPADGTLKKPITPNINVNSNVDENYVTSDGRIVG